VGILFNGSFLYFSLSEKFYSYSSTLIQGGSDAPAIMSNGGDSHMCTTLLQNFKDDKIDSLHDGFRKSFIALSKRLPKSFYIATHDKKIDSIRASIMQYNYYYETRLSNIIANLYQKKKAEGKETIFLDVGGNIGWFSLVAAAHGASRIYTFEPNVQNTIRFCESLSLNGWLTPNFVTPIQKGVGNVSESLNLYIPGNTKNNPGAFTFKKPYASAESVGRMNITTLDEFAESEGWFDNKPSIPMFKLDVEMFERQVIEGAQRLLNSQIIEYIAMELKPEHDELTKLKIVTILMEAEYGLYMHGMWYGPDTVVTKNYTSPIDLVKDLQKGVYRENVVFRHNSIHEGLNATFAN